VALSDLLGWSSRPGNQILFTTSQPSLSLGLIRLHADAGDAVGEDSGSGESDVEEQVEVERRLDHDHSRFEIVHLSAAPAVGGGGSEDDKDKEARAARLEEENLPILSRNFI